MKEQRKRPGRAGIYVLFVLLAVLAAGVIWKLAGSSPSYIWPGRVLGCNCIIRVHDSRMDSGLRRTLDAEIPKLIGSLEAMFSRRNSSSVMTYFNSITSSIPVNVGPDVWRVADFKRKIYDSCGAVSLTIGPIEDFWRRVAAGGAAAPAPGDVRRMLVVNAPEKIDLTAEPYIRKIEGDARISLDDVAPGFVADQLAKYLSRKNIAHYCVRVGGAVVTSAMIDQIGPIPIYPSGVKTAAPARAAIQHGGMVTVGGPGALLCVDPRDGYPVSNGVGSVSVVAPNGLAAGGIASALYVLGPKKGLVWLRNNDVYTNAEALFVMKKTGDKTPIFTTDGFPLVQP